MAAMRRVELNMHMAGWGGSTGDLDNILRINIFGEIAGKPWNVGSYINPEVDRLIVAGSQEMDVKKRAEIYATLQKIVWDDAPWLFLYRQIIFIVHKADIKGIHHQPGLQALHFWMAYRDK